MLLDALRGLFEPGGWWLLVKLIALAFAAAAILRLIPVRRTIYHGRRTARRFAVISAAVALALGAGGVYVLAHNVYVPAHNEYVPAHNQRGLAQISPPAANNHRQQLHYLGVFESGELASYQPVSRFGRVVGAQPQIVLYYSAWPAPFDTQFAAEAAGRGAIPYVDWEPRGVRMSAVADGKSDPYLRSFAADIRLFRHQVLISFAPEANGNWYSWGWKHTSPAIWVRAWQHVVTLFRRMGATNVIWVWNVNRSGGGVAPVTKYWPGASYVDWVGIDGYYYHPRDTFSKILAPTVRAIRRLTAKPILLSETAIGQVTGQAKAIPDLFKGIRSYGLIGLVWFDRAQHDGLYHQDWRLEGHPAAIAAFRLGVAAMLASPG